MINSARLLQTFLELVQTDSLSLRERKVGQYILRVLAELGLKVKVDDAAEKIGGEFGNVIAVLESNCEGADAVLLNSHMDTVGPAEGIKPLVIDGIVRSDGKTVLGADDKAGIAVILEGLRSVLESGMEHGRIEIAFTVAEEIGLLGSKNLDLSEFEANHVFILDGEGEVGGIVIRAPSQNSIKATFKGKAAHAGLNPEEGVSAIRAAAEAISCMKLGRIDKETTANVGIMRGGRAANIVPEEAYLEGEARSLSEEKLESQTREMEKCLEEAASRLGAQVETVITRAYSAFNLSPENEIVKIAAEAAGNLGIKARLTATGGGSDTNVFNEAGLPAINLSVGYENVHTTREKVPVENLEKAARYLFEIISVVASHRRRE